MHCYFVFAGDGEVPILYYVDRVADHPGKVVRAVRAKQGERLIFTATLNFSSSVAGSGRDIEHSVPVPAVDPPPSDEGDGAWDSDRPFQSFSAGFVRTSNPLETCQCSSIPAELRSQETSPIPKTRRSDNGLAREARSPFPAGNVPISAPWPT
jgi:acyl-CoA thioesterase II